MQYFYRSEEIFVNQLKLRFYVTFVADDLRGISTRCIVVNIGIKSQNA